MFGIRNGRKKTYLSAMNKIINWFEIKWIWSASINWNKQMNSEWNVPKKYLDSCLHPLYHSQGCICWLLNHKSYYSRHVKHSHACQDIGQVKTHSDILNATKNEENLLTSIEHVGKKIWQLVRPLFHWCRW